MATKSTSRFVCQSCGDDFLRWEGQCRSCGDLEQPRRDGRPRARARTRCARRVAVGAGPRIEPVALADIGEADVPRLATGIGELDRVLGGGIVPGSLVLVGGEPGIGKSTLLLQVAAGVWPARSCTRPARNRPAQVRLRAGRLGPARGRPGPTRSRSWPSTTSGRSSRPRAQRRPAARHRRLDPDRDGRRARRGGRQRRPGPRVDRPADGLREGRGRSRSSSSGTSPRTGRSPDPRPSSTSSTPSSRSRASATRPCAWSARPRTASARPRRSASSRWPAAGMLEVDRSRRGRSWPSTRSRRRAASSHRRSRAAGRCSSRSRRWSRRRATGRPPARRAGSTRTGSASSSPSSAAAPGIGLGSHDVYANLAGGLTVAEPGLDLPIALALASSLRDRPIPADTVVIGEVGLLGELRAVTGLERRLREAARLGFRAPSCPRPGRGAVTPDIPGLRAASRWRPLRDAVTPRSASAVGPWRRPYRRC